MKLSASGRPACRGNDFMIDGPADRRRPGPDGPAGGRGAGGRGQSCGLARVVSWSAYSMRSAQSAGQAAMPWAAPTKAPARRGDRVGVTGGGGAPGQRADRVVGVPEGAEQRGGQRLLGDPALPGEPARVAAVVGAGQRGVEAGEGAQALVPAPGDELRRRRHAAAAATGRRASRPGRPRAAHGPGRSAGRAGRAARRRRAAAAPRTRSARWPPAPVGWPWVSAGLELGQPGERVQVDVEAARPG